MKYLLAGIAPLIAVVLLCYHLEIIVLVLVYLAILFHIKARGGDWTDILP